jgi:hypothetical protein
MGATSGTRRGNGAGWGGPAKGAGAPPGSGQGGRPKGVKNGEGKRTIADLMANLQAREKIAKAWMVIIEDSSHPQHATMLVKGAERLDGAPVQPIEAGAAGPLIIERVIIDNVTDRDAEGLSPVSGA